MNMTAFFLALVLALGYYFYSVRKARKGYNTGRKMGEQAECATRQDIDKLE